LLIVGKRIVLPFISPHLAGPIGASSDFETEGAFCFAVTVACRLLACQKPSLAGHQKAGPKQPEICIEVVTYDLTGQAIGH
jgi:hypothetical protein